GGIWGGQLQKYRHNKYHKNHDEPDAKQIALGPRVARLSADMLHLEEPVREIEILDKQGNPLRAADNKRRFFEASWMHKYNNQYYFSYSTGDTHFICYAV